MGLGLGWAFFLASLSSLEVECLSPPSPTLLRAAGPRSGNKKQDSITGRWNPKWPRLPPYVCSCECVCLRGSHPYLSYILYLIFFVLTVFACLLHPFPSEHTLALRPLPTTSCRTHPEPSPPPHSPYVWSVFLEPLLCQQPTFCALAVGESDLSTLCLPLDTVDNCRL